LGGTGRELQVLILGSQPHGSNQKIAAGTGRCSFRFKFTSGGFEDNGWLEAFFSSRGMSPSRGRQAATSTSMCLAVAPDLRLRHGSERLAP